MITRAGPTTNALEDDAADDAATEFCIQQLHLSKVKPKFYTLTFLKLRENKHLVSKWNIQVHLLS